MLEKQINIAARDNYGKAKNVDLLNGETYDVLPEDRVLLVTVPVGDTAAIVLPPAALAGDMELLIVAAGATFGTLTVDPVTPDDAIKSDAAIGATNLTAVADYKWIRCVAGLVYKLMDEITT